MEENSEMFGRRRPVPTLTRENHETWFRMMEFHLKGEGIWSVIKESDSTADSWERNDAKAQYAIEICIGEMDRRSTQKIDTARERWNALKKQYTENLPSQGRRYLQEYISFRMEDGQSIQDAWTILLTLSQKVASTQPTMAAAMNMPQVFQQLLAALPEGYSVVRDSIDTAKILTTTEVESNLLRLQEKEHQLQENVQSAMIAQRWKNFEKYEKRREERTRRDPSPRRQSSHSHQKRRVEDKTSRRDKTPPRQKANVSCYICDGQHFMRDCLLFKEVRKLRDAHKDKRNRQKRERAHRTEEDSSSQSQSAPSSPSSSGHQEVTPPPSEEAYVSEVTKKFLQSTTSKRSSKVWIADTGASSHMTYQPELFRGQVKPTPGGTVEVGGGRKLKIEGKGVAVMKMGNGTHAILSDVLLVPDLGVNLLSGNALCRKGLRGSFDDHALYMRSKEGDLYIKAIRDGGVYTVNWLANSLEETALVSLCEDIVSTDEQPMEEHALDATETIAEDDPEYTLWHRRFAHLGKEKIRHLHEVTTMKKPIKINSSKECCETCAITKMRNRRSHELAQRKQGLLDLVSIDIAGPDHKSLKGNRYFLEIVDNHTRYVWVIPLPDRLDAVNALKKWKLAVELESDTKLKAVRCDNAPELKKTLDEWAITYGIRPEYTVIHTSSQNGIPERAIQSTRKSIRAMLKEANLPLEFWDEAAKTDAYIRNRTSTNMEVEGNRVSPYMLWHGTTPSISHMRVWGCKCISYVNPNSIPNADRHGKLDNPGRIAVFMGYDEYTDSQYYVYAPDLKRVVKTSIVTFLEDVKGGTVVLGLSKKDNNTVQQDLEWVWNDLKPRQARGRPKRVEVTVNQEQASIPTPESKDQDMTAQEEGQGQALPQKQAPLKFSHVQIPAPEVQPVQLEKRKRLDEGDDSFPEPKHIRALLAMLAEEKDDIPETVHSVMNRVPIPVRYDDAINDPIFGKEWKQAIEEEILSLTANNTWKYVVAPQGSNIVSCKWVFDVKYTIAGGIERFKARLVARGFSQIPGLDYFETFAPTVRTDTLRILLALVALEDLECHVVDVKNAFTESHLKEDIYMQPPQGVEVEKGMVLKILRSLYGLKQAARDWHKKCTSELEKMGFCRLMSDPCVFRHKNGIILSMHVDDIMIVSRRIHEINWFKQGFASIFKIKDLGEIRKILGMKVTRDRKQRTIIIDQEAYIEKILQKNSMIKDTFKPTALPMSGYECITEACDEDNRVDTTDYQRRIGDIMHTIIYSRPDAAFAIAKLAQFMSRPYEHHAAGLKHVLRYLRSTSRLGIKYGPCENQNLVGYSDADYAADKSDRKSTSGFIFSLGGGAVSWASKKQRSVSTSTTEAEYLALSTCSKHAVWIGELLRETGFPQYLGGSGWTTQLKGDNQSALALVKNPQVNDRTKHIDVAYHHIRDLQEKQKIQIEYIPTHQMVADGLTKPLKRPQFDDFVRRLGMTNCR